MGWYHQTMRSIVSGNLVGICLLASCASDPASPTPEPLFEPLLTPFADGSYAGAPGGRCLVPSAALAEVPGAPSRVVGSGTPGSCTPDAFRAAVALGGLVTFDCGASPHTIVLDAPAKVVNDAYPDVVLDGQGKITLSGGKSSRILYMNTCDRAQVWTTSHCQDQDHPRLVVKNLTFRDGDASSHGEDLEGGGGAIWSRGGSLKVFHCRFYGNVAAGVGADVGGGAIRAFDQSRDDPVQVVNSTFGTREEGNVASNGGALSSIGVNWSIWNSEFTGNRATGTGGNPAVAGSVGGGSGGAIYNDGNTLTLSVCGSVLEANQVRAYGAAIFFVSNNHDGMLRVLDSRISGNLGGSWHALPGISMHEDTRREIVGSVLEN